jgi:hypothetical protein
MWFLKFREAGTTGLGSLVGVTLVTAERTILIAGVVVQHILHKEHVWHVIDKLFSESFTLEAGEVADLVGVGVFLT